MAPEPDHDSFSNTSIQVRFEIAFWDYMMGGDRLERVANGFFTRMLVDRLEQLMQREHQERYRVYFDHKVRNPDRILAQVGKGAQTEDMAHLDFAIVDTAEGDERLVVVSEIEEHKHAPKRLLGDIAAILMSEKVKIDCRDHPLENADIVLGVVTKREDRLDRRQ
jgi:hypothetical protein